MAVVDLPDTLFETYELRQLRDPRAPIVLRRDVHLWLMKHRVRCATIMKLGVTAYRDDHGRRSTTYIFGVQIEFEDPQWAMLFKLTWL